MKRSGNTDKDAFNVWKSSGNCPDDPGCIGVAPGAVPVTRTKADFLF